ncbi:hypothetical protein FACS189490_03480 [Clostridia bacterium]|nr:hypothetical protein FACS189490_03480 [Clostridia bacterium]
MNENTNSASESAATPRAQSQETAPQSAAAPLMENQYVQELFSIMHDNGKDTKGLSALIGHVGEMESFVTRAEQQIVAMKSQLAEMKEVQNHPIKTALTSAIKALETKVAEVKERIGELKTAIIGGAKSAVQAFKENGAAALHNLAKFFHIKGALKAVDKSMTQSAATCDRAVANIQTFSREYHETGKHLKNMGRLLTGKPPIDTAKETGKLAAVISAPYKAEKAALRGIQKAAGAMIAKLEQLETAQDAKQARRDIERKPPERKIGIIGELEANIAMLAAQDRERAVPDKSRQKEAVI